MFQPLGHNYAKLAVEHEGFDNTSVVKISVFWYDSQ